MVTKLKKKINKYLSQVWLIEIVLVVLIGGYVGVEFYKQDKSGSNILSSVEAIMNPQSYYIKDLNADVKIVSSYIYRQTNSLADIYYSNEKASSKLQDTFLENKNIVVQTLVGNDYKKVPNNVNFIIRNKTTGSIITNDNDLVGAVDGVKYNESYILNKYKGKCLLLKYDNINNYNPIIDLGLINYNQEVVGNYEEYYYTTLDSYLSQKDYLVNKRKVNGFFIIVGIAIMLSFKVVTVLAMNKGKIKIRGNFILTIKYVLQNGFKYKQTRRTLMTTIICLVIFFIGYLYFLAIGGTENNILVTFFRLYPFKGSMFLMVLPVIGIMYSMKTTIDIYKVNDSLKLINEGNVKHNIVENGGAETLELIENITRIKDGYKIAVEDTLKNEKLKTELISNVSHDLRTPLTSIINYVNILSEEDITEEERKDYLKIVDAKSKRLKILIDDLFEMSKINSGKIELNKERIDVMSLIHQAIGEYSYLYENKNIEFKVDSFEEEIYIELDGKMISRAIENIVINSLKYSLEGTRVYVNVKNKGENLEISFKNISNYEMNFDNEEIFERFARGDGSRNSKIEGSGLGLAITKSIIELHEGNVLIRREGDMFKIYIYLPYLKEE